MHHLSKSQRATSHALAALSLLIASACGREEPTAPVIDALQSRVHTQVVGWRQLNDSIPPIEIGLPRDARPWDGGPEALKSWVAETGGRVLIGLKPANEARTAQTGVVPGIARTVFEQALQELLGRGVTVLQTFQTMPIVYAIIDPDAVPVLIRLPFVNYIEPDVPMRAGYAGSSRLRGFIQSSTQDTSWGLENIRAPQAWEVGFRGSGANIWILDSGVDETHATSPDGDWNLNNARCSWAIAHFDGCFEITPGLGHGSLVHTVAVGPDNAVGYIGVANGASGNTMVRICTNGDICYPGPIVGSLDTALAIGDPRTIVNISSSGENDFVFLREAVVRAWVGGILMVAIAGNNNDPASGILYPAKYDDVIAVTGTTQSNGFAGPGVMACAFSNSGAEAELSAPFEQSGARLEGGYQTDCGTSFGAPAVAGVAALVWGKNPSWTAMQVRTHLQNTAVDLGPAGRDAQFGYGRVDACAAVECQVSFTLNGPGALETNQTGMWSASSVSGGISPYSYRWYVDGVLRGTSQSFSTSFSNTGTYVVKVRVTPATGVLREKSMNVTVTGGGGCLFPPCS